MFGDNVLVILWDYVWR
uniref:Uncharacterized protein n=1 Tax=Rhizophora mucronata TaxID=61149 RepID=A0A2P2QIY6_RHIMU